MLDRRNLGAWLAASVLVGSLLLLSGVIITTINYSPPPTPHFGPPWPTLPAATQAVSHPPSYNPVSGFIPHPTGKRDIVIRLVLTGGWCHSDFCYVKEDFPKFTLYGDGTAIYVSQTGIHVIHMDEAGIQPLLNMIINKKYFFGLATNLPEPRGGLGTDMITTAILVVAAGQEYLVSAYGLGSESAGQSTPERQTLKEVESAIRDLMADDAPFYQPATAILYISFDTVPLTGRITATPDPAIPAWPVPGVRLAEASPIGEYHTPGLRLTGTAAVAALEAAAHSSQFMQDGQLYTVMVMPELPELLGTSIP